MIIKTHGFDAIDDTQLPSTFDSSTGGVDIIYPGRYGGNALHFSNTEFSHTLLSDNLANATTVIQGGDIVINGNLSVGKGFYFLMDGTTCQISLGFDDSGHLIVRTNEALDGTPGGTILETTTASYITSNQWRHIEWKVTIGSSGSVEVRVDKTVVISLTGVNTQTTAHSYATAAALHFADLTSNGRAHDNYYVLDTTGSSYNDFIGPQKITTHLPTANGTNINWTGLALPNYTQIDDWANKVTRNNSPVPDDNVSYISSGPNASDVVDTYTLNGFSTSGTNNAIQMNYWAKSDVSSGLREIKATLYNGTLYKGSAIALNAADTNWHYYSDLSFALNDPATATAWTVSALNSFEFGVTNFGNAGGGGDTATAYITQMVIERMSSAFDPFAANNPLTIV